MRGILASLLAFLAAAPAAAGLKPDEIAVIALASSSASREVAEYYCQARGIPAEHIMLLEASPGTTLPREEWNTQVRPAIRQWLAERGLTDQIRCLVTCYDVPLNIGAQTKPSEAEEARRAALAEARGRLVNRFGELLDELAELGRTGAAVTPHAFAADTPVADLNARFDAVLKSAQARAQGLAAEQQREISQQFEQGIVLAGGNMALLRLGRQQVEGTGRPPEQVPQIALLHGRQEGLELGLHALGQLGAEPLRDAQMLFVLERSHGLVGSIQWIDQQQQVFSLEETHASFDSELSLLHWPDYPLYRWQPNLLHYTFRHRNGRPRTLMVSRLEAPSVELVKGLIDAAIRAEREGLSGKVYLDARGMEFHPERDGRGSYGEYDQSLRDLAARLEAHTDLEVILDNEPALFQPGDCPGAALYCGWYSLAKYVDAFEWEPGAVGYHMASAEARSLREGNAWCAAMIREGVAATLGPTHEPYLGAFPLPDDFFSLLLTGEYTLVETYYRTNPFNSWVMVLVGDPLYNPFKNAPKLSRRHLPERMTDPDPLSPAAPADPATPGAPAVPGAPPSEQ